VTADYDFHTEWRVAGIVAEVRDVLADGRSLPRWWPAVYLAADVLEEGDESGSGREIALFTTGLLPYTLRWTMRVTEPITDTGFALTATGDLVGTGGGRSPRTVPRSSSPTTGGSRRASRCCAG
jgi:hypothetical protein